MILYISNSRKGKASGKELISWWTLGAKAGVGSKREETALGVKMVFVVTVLVVRTVPTLIRLHS